MKTLQFKKEGHFLEELSARYVAEFTDNSVVKIWKCGYERQWKYSFYTEKFCSINEINGDIEPRFNCKRDVVSYLNRFVNSKEDALYVDVIEKEALLCIAERKWYEDNSKKDQFQKAIDSKKAARAKFNAQYTNA